MIDFSLGPFVCLFVRCVSVRSSLNLVRFGQVFRRADKHILNIMKVYIERNNMQVELTRFCVQNTDFIHVYICEVRNTMQYRSPNTTLDCVCQTVSIVSLPLGGRTCHTWFTIHLNGALACFFLLSCSPKYNLTLCS